jgi:hypothetical protein
MTSCSAAAASRRAATSLGCLGFAGWLAQPIPALVRLSDQPGDCDATPEGHGHPRARLPRHGDGGGAGRRRISLVIMRPVRDLRRAGFGPFFARWVPGVSLSIPTDAGLRPQPARGRSPRFGCVASTHPISRRLAKDLCEPPIAPELPWVRCATSALYFVPGRKSRGANRHNRSHPEDRTRPGHDGSGRPVAPR